MRLETKHTIRYATLLVLSCLLVSTALAQSTRKLLRKGNRFFERGNYREAASYYEKALAKEPANVKVLYPAGVSYLTFDKEKAADYLYRVQKLEPDFDRDLDYWLGRVNLINYHFDTAIEHFQEYQEELPKRYAERHEEVKRLIQNAKNAKQEVANPKDVFVKNLGEAVNTLYSEHSPAISLDDNYLLYTSRSEKATGNQEARDGEYFEDIFETKRTSEGEWDKPSVVAGELNSSVHDASIQLFDNDTKLLMYRSENNGDILVSERGAGGSWGKPRSISDQVNTRDFEADAFITPDGQTLLYSTSHYSKNGDLDIYMVKKDEKGNWGSPISVGETINTPYDDDSPFLARDGSLYFASRGHNSMGGYDIFVAKFDPVANKWTVPENLGAPINTPDEDTYYRLAPDGSYAYLTSYRLGGFGETDIYRINYIRNVNVSGQVLSKADGTSMPEVELVFNGMQANKHPISYRSVSDASLANYKVDLLSGRKYQVQFLKDGKLIGEQEFEVPLVLDEATTLTQNFYVD
ncbi:WD40 repeat protein [Pontibacter ummariensis]|uniref:WD40-like Beta Propeller Repeat n=1 Tax=Pontibacter ummariensis TaxID=1610492 RepID=A0A239EB08_9BACT|nr:tetratricopeptide repeat protein [Pontibacter ummariensis]PRY13170.1 WD40 repeat protein [Pontibacter ummariensis]SNS41826.1 WD40-like Beta Propeller Repeat [Pontibacter ummariensis]